MYKILLSVFLHIWVKLMWSIIYKVLILFRLNTIILFLTACCVICWRALPSKLLFNCPWGIPFWSRCSSSTLLTWYPTWRNSRCRRHSWFVIMGSRNIFELIKFILLQTNFIHNCNTGILSVINYIVIVLKWFPFRSSIRYAYAFSR